jgi:hypothetical protein
MTFHSQPVLRAVLFGGVAALALSGCTALRDAAGANKEPPDEFAIATKAPLIIPPDYNLHPPRTGAAPTNQLSPTQAAQSALFNSDPATVAANMTGNFSDGEKILLANAGAADADDSIRQQLASDGTAMQGADDSFTSQVLFWQAPPPPNAGTPVDADAEAKRIDSQKTSGTAAPDKKAPDDSATIQKDDGGWLDGIFGDW